MEMFWFSKEVCILGDVFVGFGLFVDFEKSFCGDFDVIFIKVLVIDLLDCYVMVGFLVDDVECFFCYELIEV